MAYAWEDDYNNLDDLLALRSPAGKATPTPVPYKKEAVINIQATPLTAPQFPEGEISRETFDGEGVPGTRHGEYYRRVHNDKLRRYEESTSPIVEDREKYSQEADDISKRLNKGQAVSFQRVNQDLPEYQRPDVSYQDLLKDMKSQPKDSGDQDMATLLINSFGPGILGIGTGGYAGADAALATQKYANDQQQKSLDRSAKEKQTRLAIEGKRLEGIGSIAKAEGDINKAEFDKGMDVAKFRQEAFNKTMDREVDLYKSGKTTLKDFTEKAAAISKEYADQTNKGITDIKTTEQKDIDAQNAMEMEKLKQEGALKRAKVGAKAIQNKPATESERKWANVASAMQQGEQAYQRYLDTQKDRKPMSAIDPNYRNYQAIIEKADPNTLMSVIVSKIPDGPIRREIQARVKWVAAKLRGDSGAAISASEFVQENAAHFPDFGDNDETLAEKDAARKQVFESAKLAAGRAQIAPTQAPKAVPKKEVPKVDPNIKTIGNEKDGYKTYKRVNGGWQEQ